MATLIYNDRVATYHKMLKLDKVLDGGQPKPQDIIGMAEMRVRNLQAFAELQSFNDSGKWLYEHPLTADRSERAELERLRRQDPEKFLSEYSNCRDNCRRYARYVKDPKRESRRDTNLKLLREHRRRSQLFRTILQSDTDEEK